MSWFPFLSLAHFGLFITYSAIGALLLYFNYRAKINKVASCIMFCFALWSFVKIFSHNVNTPKNVALLLENVFSFSWILAPSVAFYFFATLTKNDGLLKSKKIHVILVIIVFSFYYRVLSGGFFEDLEMKSYGWFRAWKNSIWVYFFYAYVIISVFYGLFLLLQNYIRTKNKAKKRIFKTFLVSSAGTFMLLLFIEFFEIIFAFFKLKKGFLEDIPNFYLLIFAIPLLYLINKYKFMKISPVYAAETVISSMNESLIITDDEINISYMNENSRIMFAKNSGVFIGKPFAILFKNKKDIATLLKELLKKDFIKNFETDFITTEGNEIPVMISASVIKQLGEMTGVVFIISDITEFKKARETLKESYKKLVEVDILKTHFLSMISHELRTPLTTIIGFLTLMLGGATGKIPEYLKEYLEIMHKNSQRLLSLINDLLDLSKMEAGTFTISKIKTDIIHLIEETIKNLEPLCTKKNIFISFDTTVKSFKISIDPVRIAQVISNLLNNAIKFSKTNSKIIVLLYVKNKNDIKAQSDLDDLSLKNENYLNIKIIDEGIGIPPDAIGNIFNKFFQAEDINTRRAQGAGLGLYISKEIITKHNGYIWAESEGQNKGSTFTILLPVD